MTDEQKTGDEPVVKLIDGTKVVRYKGGVLHGVELQINRLL